MRVRAAIEAYLEEGDAREMSPLELRDQYDISSPGLAEDAGYTEEEQASARRTYDAVANARYGALFVFFPPLRACRALISRRLAEQPPSSMRIELLSFRQRQGGS